MSHTHTELLTDIERYDFAYGDDTGTLTVRVTLDITMSAEDWFSATGKTDPLLIVAEARDTALAYTWSGYNDQRADVAIVPQAAVTAVKRANNLFPKAGA